MKRLIFVLGMLTSPAVAFAQGSSDAQQDHAVDQLVGSWVYQSCEPEPVVVENSCSTVERTYQPAAEGDLLYYTESVDGEEREGFVGYDASAGTFVEYDYPQEWTRDDFERSFYSEQTDLALRGEEAYTRNLQWQMNEDGDTMSLRTASGEVTHSTSEFLGVVFSRVPVVGSDPIIGGQDD